jgi:hypothetical protein
MSANPRRRRGKAIRARRSFSLTCSNGRPLVRAAHRRYHARIRLHSVPALAASAAQNGVWHRNPPSRGIDRPRRAILSQQLPDGGFNIYVKGPSEISASVKAYFALKLAAFR